MEYCLGCWAYSLELYVVVCVLKFRVELVKVLPYCRRKGSRGGVEVGWKEYIGGDWIDSIELMGELKIEAIEIVFDRNAREINKECGIGIGWNWEKAESGSSLSDYKVRGVI